jgi:hypothetical protein
LDTENKRLTRALVREVGEDVPLARVLDEGSDWRGRREQIVHLRDTIRALREATAQAGGSDSAAAGLLARHDAAHRSAIGRANKERVRETERMMSELEAARKSAEDLRLQYTGACSRRKVVETELAGLRNKLAIVLAKTQTDDKLIAALRAEVARCSRCDMMTCQPHSAFVYGNINDAVRQHVHMKLSGCTRITILFKRPSEPLLQSRQLCQCGCSASTTDTSSSNRERQELRAQVTQLQSRLDQQLHVIGCLQAERRTGLASDSSQLEELAKENAELRLLAGGTADALGRQVIALQCENMALRAQLLGGEDASVQQRLELSPAQLTVLQDAREASAAGAAG